MAPRPGLVVRQGRGGSRGVGDPASKSGSQRKSPAGGRALNVAPRWGMGVRRHAPGNVSLLRTVSDPGTPLAVWPMGSSVPWKSMDPSSFWTSSFTGFSSVQRWSAQDLEFWLHSRHPDKPRSAVPARWHRPCGRAIPRAGGRVVSPVSPVVRYTSGRADQGSWAASRSTRAAGSLRAGATRPIRRRAP